MQMVCPKCKGVKLRTVAEAGGGGGGLGWGQKKPESKRPASPTTKTKEDIIQGSDGTRAGAISRVSQSSGNSSTQVVSDHAGDSTTNIHVQNLTLQITESVLNQNNQSSSSTTQHVASTTQAAISEQLAAIGEKININAENVHITQAGQSSSEGNADSKNQQSSDSGENDEPDEDAEAVDKGEGGAASSNAETGAAASEAENAASAEDVDQRPLLLNAFHIIRNAAEFGEVLENMPLEDSNEDQEWQEKHILALEASEEGLMTEFLNQKEILPKNSMISLGLSPKKFEEIEQFIKFQEILEEVGSSPICVGPTGIDLHYAGYAINEQKTALKAHVDYAEKLGGKPIILNLKGDAEQLIQALAGVVFNQQVLLNAPAGGAALYQHAKDQKWFLSVTPDASYEAMHENYREAIKSWPIDKLLLASGTKLLLPESLIEPTKEQQSSESAEKAEENILQNYGIVQSTESKPKQTQFNQPKFVIEMLTWLAEWREVREDKLLEQLSLNAKSFLR
jgi:Tat protein secretion system quality control protein TatD with DNase activity